MIKRISIILLTLGILATGILGFRKLSYWERSAWIFKYKNMDRRLEGRGGRGAARFEGRPPEAQRGFGERPGRTSGERPDRELREGTEGGEFRERPEGEFRERPEAEFRERAEGRADFGHMDRGRGGHGRGDFHGGKKVRLRNVAWFLAVFSGFTVLFIYVDRWWKRFRKRKTSANEREQVVD
jgi:hypothetical protein